MAIVAIFLDPERLYRRFFLPLALYGIPYQAEKGQ
jgi:hypothetical protein